jgi:hypothetical protein
MDNTGWQRQIRPEVHAQGAPAFETHYDDTFGLFKTSWSNEKGLPQFGFR